MAIENLTRNQENCQKQYPECFTNLSQAMTDITERGGNASSGSGTGKFSGGFNLNNCWFHGTNGHDILESEVFKILSD